MNENKILSLFTMIKDWNLSFLPNTSSSSSSLSHKTPLLFPSSSHETIHNNKNKNNNNNNTTIIGLCTPPGICNLGATCYLNIQFEYLASKTVFLRVHSFGRQRQRQHRHQQQDLSRFLKIMG